MPPIPPDAMKDLRDAILNGTCVPFLGAGLSAGNPPGLPGLPLGGELARRMKDELVALSLDGNFIRNPWNFPEVATHYELHRTRFNLVKFLRDNIPHTTIDPLPAHRKLAQLPLKLIITTNYDTLMERALDIEHKDKMVVVQPRGGFKDLAIQNSLVRCKELILYKMHGCLSQLEDNLVITEDDYFEFLLIANMAQVGVPSHIAALFSTGTLLFLGFSLEDMDFRMLHKVLEKFPAANRPPSFAIQLNSTDFARRYWGNRGIRIFDADVQEFVSTL